MPKKLETMDAETLMTTPIEPLKFIVSSLIPQGLHILAGSPKIGKSWLALWICLQVAKGETFLWELIKPIEAVEQKVDESMILLSDFMKSTAEFTGTATELAEQLKRFGGADHRPAVLKKKMIKHMAYLNQNNIHYAENRTFERREFTLRYDSNDGMTAETAP